jgi:GLPGLI family protein
MMTFKKIAFCLLFAFPFAAFCQSFLSGGTITYERKIQIHKILEDNKWMKGGLDKVPQFYLSKFEMKFNADTTLYTKVSDDEEMSNFAWSVYARDNETSNIFSVNQVTTKINIFHDSYIIKDSVRKYNWKLVNETRKIAGIECKKATTIINDSIFVVAFYAENIMVSGGPEDLGGLPGMILGLVVPRLHVSYYAQKIEISQPNIQLPKNKSKPMSRSEFREMVMQNMKWAFENSPIGSLYLFL